MCARDKPRRGRSNDDTDCLLPRASNERHKKSLTGCSTTVCCPPARFSRRVAAGEGKTAATRRSFAKTATRRPLFSPNAETVWLGDRIAQERSEDVHVSTLNQGRRFAGEYLLCQGRGHVSSRNTHRASVAAAERSVGERLGGWAAAAAATTPSPPLLLPARAALPPIHHNTLSHKAATTSQHPTLIRNTRKKEERRKKKAVKRGLPGEGLIAGPTTRARAFHPTARERAKRAEPVTMAPRIPVVRFKEGGREGAQRAQSVRRGEKSSGGAAVVEAWLRGARGGG